MFRYLLSLSLLLTATLATGQGWERVYDGGGQGQINDIANTPDGGFVMTGYYNLNSRIRLFKTDADGFLQWTQDFTLGTFNSGNAVIVTKDGGYAVAGYFKVSSDPIQAFILKTDNAGKLLWTKLFNSNYDADALDLLELPDGSLVACGYQKTSGANNSEDVLVIKTSADGVLAWSKTFGDMSIQEKGNSITLANDGDLVIAGERGSIPRDFYVAKISSADGSLDWENTFGLFEILTGAPADDAARGVVATADGNFVLAGRSTLVQGVAGILMKIDGAGSNTILWNQDFPKTEFYGMAPAANGGFYATGNKTTTAAQEDLFILKTDSEGNKICEVAVGRAGVDVGFSIVPTPDGGAAAAGQGDFFIGPLVETNPYLVKTDKNCLVFTSYLSGHIFHDLNANCQPNANEPGLEDWIVKIESPNFTRYAAANANGDFQLLVDTGTYKIQLFPPNNAWKSCDAVITLPVTGFSDTFPINIPVQASFACPRNEVDVATPVLRRCTDNTYTVRYCNSGTIASLNTRVEVTIDPNLSIVNSSIPVASQQDNTYTFNVGYLANGDCGSFTIDAYLDCDNTITGQTHCVKAHIFPDTFCNVASNWDRSIVTAQASCENDSVRLVLKNTGSGDMSELVGFVITEDVLMLTAPNDPANVFKLNSGEEFLARTIAANGSTYRIIAHQTSGYPGLSYPTAAVEGCKPDTSISFSTGFYTMFPEDDAEAFKASDCQESNDTDFNPTYLKRGHPKGYNVDRYVQPEADLEYLIQFQNSGTDTVHQVIIRDTLSPYLDPTTVHPGAASHPYDFDVYGNGIVQFTLPNLNLLPGSSSSEGYVKFRVSQKPELACNTKIFNSAAIYFDFNAPVLSNQTFHTVCFIDTFAVVQTKDIQFEGADIKVYPNPFDESATFEVTGVTDASGFNLELYDMLGRKVFNQTFNHPSFRLYRHHLPAGTFFYRLTTSKGRPVASGKLLVR